jgi:hypothetical protein
MACYSDSFTFHVKPRFLFRFQLISWPEDGASAPKYVSEFMNLGNENKCRVTVYTHNTEQGATV